MEKFIAGGLSGIIEVLGTHPFDYIKTQMQYNNKFQLNKIKFTQLYTGIIPRVIGVAPMRLVFWGMQDTTSCYLFYQKINTPFNFLIIGSISAFCQTIIDNQIEQLKIAQITNKKFAIKNLITTFNGFQPTLYRNMIFASSISYFCFNKKLTTTHEKIIYPMIGSFIGTILSQPLDYVKTIKQSTNCNDSIIQIMKKNKNNLFIGGFYRSSLSIISMSIGFFVYNELLSFMEC